MNTYLNLCTEVYELSKPNPPEDAYLFYKEYALSANGRILEPMCGTGRYLLPLLKEGFDIEGFDASESMLSKLWEKARVLNVAPKVEKSFIEELEAVKKYKMIFIPSCSFCLFSDLSVAKNALDAMAKALSDDGVLLIEVLTPVGDPSKLGVWDGSLWKYNDSKKILLSTLSSLEDNVLSSICKYELIENNRLLETEIEEMQVRLYEHEQISVMLRVAGFSKVNAIKAFDASKKSDDLDEVVVYECRK